MRVASMTLDGYFNYGNNLQKYALHRTLKKFADFTEVFWYSKNDFYPETGEIRIIKPIPSGTDPITANRYYFREVVRVNKIKEFENRYIRTRFDLPYLEDIADEYDFFVVGSDQVWNPDFITNMRFTGTFLNFVPREKRIAYAASIAAPVIPDNLKEFFRAGISGFDHISVREEGAVKIIKELTGLDALLVLDPTMLLTAEEWLEIAQKPSWFDEKYERGYILTYYLRKDPPQEVQIMARKMNLPVINLLDLDNYWHYVVGPEEFVGLFANASLVCTNSFHGVAFSIVFRKPFINLEIANDIDGVNMSLRIPSLLKMFGLENRTAGAINSPLEIDYSVRDKVLPAEREKAFKFLSKALGVKPRQIWKGGGGV